MRSRLLHTNTACLGKIKSKTEGMAAQASRLSQQQAMIESLESELKQQQAIALAQSQIFLCLLLLLTESVQSQWLLLTLRSVILELGQSRLSIQDNSIRAKFARKECKLWKRQLSAT